MTDKMLPIMSPCGDEIEVGTMFFYVNEKEVNSYSHKKEVVRTFSGLPGFEIERYKVIRVCERADSRSFVIRSTRGCELSYSVKNECLPPYLFTRLPNAKKYAAEIHKEDLRKVANKVEQFRGQLKEAEDCLKKLRRVKF